MLQNHTMKDFNELMQEHFGQLTKLKILDLSQEVLD